MEKYKPYKREMPHSYAFGASVSLELLRARPGDALALLVSPDGLENAGAKELMACCENLGVPCAVDGKAISRLSPKGNCYAIAVYRKQPGTLSDGPHIVLCQPSDSGNAGSILRTALGFGVRDAAFIAPCVDPDDPRVVRASMGAAFRARTRVFDSFDEYREAHPGHAPYPFMSNARLSLPEMPPPKQPWALVFGNEASGLPPEFAQTGTPVRIPQSLEIDSLNLSVAVGIALYHFTASFNSQNQNLAAKI